MTAIGPLPSPAQQAYAALWRSHCTDPWSRAARQALLDGLTKDERREAIAWIIRDYGPVSDAEMIAADIRLGTFPERSYTPPEKAVEAAKEI